MLFEGLKKFNPTKILLIETQNTKNETRTKYLLVSIYVEKILNF